MLPIPRRFRSRRDVVALALIVGLGGLASNPVPALSARSPFLTPSADTCGPITKLYTTDADFNLGALNGVVTNSNQLELSSTATTWPYAWIANAGEGTISKVNTQTGNEEGRYYSGPPDNSSSHLYLSPSRTVVDRNGNCWVANRTTGPYRPSVTQFVVTGGDDRNANSNIETSTDLNSDGDCADPGELLPWGVDERVKRHYEIGNMQNVPARGMVIDKLGFLWVGLSQTNTLHKLNPNLPIATYAPNQPPAVAPSLATIDTGHFPYGLALSPNGMIYMSTCGSWALEIDPGLASGGTAFGPAVTADSIFHDGGNYGIAVDKNCVVWLALALSPVAWEGCVRWDPSLTNGNPANGWTISGPGAPAAGRGITVDFNNNVWMSSSDANNSVVRYSNTPTPTLTGTFSTPAPNPCGLGVASDGGIIVTPNGGSLWCKLDPVSGLQIPLPGPELAGPGPYTYSDFTGSLQSVTSFQQGTWNVTTDGLHPARIWNFVGWNQSTPPSTSVSVEARTAQTLPQLLTATWITIGAPGPQTPMYGRFIETQVRLIRNVEGCAATFVTPILYDLTVAGICDTCAFAFCPNDTTVACEGPLGAIVEYPMPMLEENCGPGYTFVCSPPVGNFPIGVTPVICMAISGTDTVVCKFNVTVLPGCDPTPTGACCLHTNCIVTTEASCLQQGGIYFGNGSNCTVGCNYNCVPPPNKMSVWLKLDPPSGALGADPGMNLANPSLPGVLVNGPTPLPGERVNGSYHFDGATQYVELPAAAGAVGAGDFSIDAWVKSSAASGIAPIVDARGAAPVHGYGFFLDNGYPALQLATGGASSTFALDDLTAGPEAFVADGNWHLVAVSVDRDQADGVRFYVDGHPAGPAYDPTPHAGSLDAGVPLYVARSHPAPVARWFPGPIDEIEIIQDVISPAKVAEIHAAGAGGKCPELCYATKNVPCCDGVSSSSAVTICNYDAVSHVYSYGLSPINGGPGCSAVGPTSFNPNTGTVTVPAGGCVTVPIIIGCPTNIPLGQVACYQVSLFNHDTGRLFACQGSVTRPNKWCIKWDLGVPIGVGGVTPLGVGSATFNLKLRNLQRTTGAPLDYQIRAFGGHDDEPSTALSLNGLPPGEPVFGSLSVGPGETETVPLGVGYPAAWLIGYDRIAVFGDPSGQGLLEQISETAVRGIPPALVGVPDREPSADVAIGDRLFLSAPNPFGESARIRFRLPERAEVKLRLYDLVGRSVKIFYMEKRLEAGEHSVEWNTVDGRGELLQAGLYFLRLDAGKRNETLKVIVRR